jgi:uncharacterized membrane protein YoaK (UPF0700 family)
MEQLSQLKRRFSAMPWLLRILVAASLGNGVGFSLLPLVPGVRLGLGERELTYQELWETRVALAIIAVGVFMLVIGVAVFLRKGWVRPVLVVLPLVQLLPFLAVHWVFGAPSPVASLPFFAVSAAVWAVLAAVYLFATRSGREHFANAV